MKIGIHCNDEGKYDDFLLGIEEILDKNDIEYIRMDSSDRNFWREVASTNIFIHRWLHFDNYYDQATSILPIIEYHMGIKCYPNHSTCCHYDDKIKQYYILKRYGFPVAETYIFWNKTSALNWVTTEKLPLVFKLKSGAGSSSVILVSTKAQAKYLINRMFSSGMRVCKIPAKDALYTLHRDPTLWLKTQLIALRRRLKGKDSYRFWKVHKNYVYFQKYYAGNEWDTRVAIVGNKADAFRRFVRKNDFRASGSNLWSLDHSKIDLKFVEIAFAISKKLGFQTMAYDFIYDENRNPLLVEMSYIWGEFNYPEFNEGYWDENLVWHAGNYCAINFLITDLLQISNLNFPKKERNHPHSIKHLSLKS